MGYMTTAKELESHLSFSISEATRDNLPHKGLL
jgi:hypothetical protein